MTPLFTLEEIDRSIYENIRLGVVAAGYLPDETQYSTEAAWIAARDTLRNTLPNKELIEVMGVSTADDREEYTTSKILINRTDEIAGNIGGGGIEYIQQNNTYVEQRIPDTSTTIIYEVVYNANSVKYERIISNIISKVFGKRKTLYAMNSNGTFNTAKPFYITLERKLDSSSMDFMEKRFIFNVEDVFLSAEAPTAVTNVARITDLTITIKDRMAGVTTEGVEIKANT